MNSDMLKAESKLSKCLIRLIHETVDGFYGKIMKFEQTLFFNWPKLIQDRLPAIHEQCTSTDLINLVDVFTVLMDDAIEFIQYEIKRLSFTEI